MVIRLNIHSDCDGPLYYTTKNMGVETIVSLPRYKTRLSEYESHNLIQKLKDDPSVEKIYLYKINYPDGSLSLFANPNEPIRQLECHEQY